jgi:TolA-binding protein
MMPQDGSAEDIKRGVDLFRSGHYTEAKTFFDEFLTSNPDHPEALYYLGKLETDGTASQKYFRTFWTDHPDHPLADDALYAVCQYHYAKGYYVSAGKMYRDLVKTYSESEHADDAAYWAASCHLVADRPDSALADWRTFLSTYPDSELRDRALLGTGDALYAMANYDEAIATYKDVLKTSSERDVKSSALYRLGQCYDHLKQSETARRYYDRIINDYPKSIEWALLRGKQERNTMSSSQGSQVYTIQVGAFAHKQNAIRLHDSLAQKGYDVEVLSKYGADGSLLHAVQIGTYQDQEDAREVVERLEREERLQPRIITKSDQ